MSFGTLEARHIRVMRLAFTCLQAFHIYSISSMNSINPCEKIKPWLQSVLIRGIQVRRHTNTYPLRATHIRRCSLGKRVCNKVSHTCSLCYGIQFGKSRRIVKHASDVVDIPKRFGFSLWTMIDPSGRSYKSHLFNEISGYTTILQAPVCRIKRIPGVG